MSNIFVLDGGFSMQLSRHVNADDDIDSDPLWSSRYLWTDPAAVQQTHLDFLNAGAQVINTATYQASVPGFMEYLGLDEASSKELIKESVRIARRAVEEYMKTHADAKTPLIVGSTGPYGAFLHDGSEYTGSYIGNVSKETIMSWHRPRMTALIEEGVDLLAFDTTPALDEAEILLELLQEFPNQRAWLSFQCKDSQHIANGEDFGVVAKKAWAMNKSQLVGVGCNCVNPAFVSDLLKSVNEEEPQNIPLVVYANSGEKYTSDEGWTGKEQCRNLGEFVNDWLDLGVKYIGSCCRTDATDTSNIKKAVDKWILEKNEAS